MKKFLLLFYLLLTSLSGMAHDFEVDGIHYRIISSSSPYTVEVTYRGGNYDWFSNIYTGHVTIPKSVTYNSKTYSVTSIGSWAFLDCSGLTSVTIPNSVTNIGYQAFCGCSGLTSVSIPNSVTTIGNSAFYNTAWYNNQPNGLVYAGKVAYTYKGTMPGGTSIVLKEGTLGITNGAFNGCRGLTSITIPESVTSIGDYAFLDCSGLTSITIPKRVTTIGDSTFYHCTGLTSVTIPNSVTNIDDWAFYGCSALTSITIPNSVTSIGHDAFYKTAWYNNQPNGLVYVGKVAYKYKGTMPEGTSIVLAEGTLGIADYAFYNCSGLTSVTIPNSVTNIGVWAFYKCTGVKSVTIPNSVTSIGLQAFCGCSALTSVTIPNSVTSIGGSAFSSCTGLTSVIIPNSMTSIGNEFSGCSGLTSVTIPNSVTSIGWLAFDGCSGLASVTIPNSVTSIGSEAFKGCTGLTSITIPNSVTSIGSDAFDGTAWYNNQPNGLVYAGKVAYKYKGTMSEGTNIILEEGTASITDYAFNSCSGLTSITIPNSVTSIGSSAFPPDIKCYISQNSPSILSLWNNKNIVVDKVTGNTLTPPTIVARTTASSVDIMVNGYYPQFEYTLTAMGKSEIYVENHIKVTGMNPNTNVGSASLKVSLRYDFYSPDEISFKTDVLTLEAQQPKVISEGNVIVSAKSNLDDEETNVGFEWRRQDWNDDFDSKTGGAYLYNGEMEGYIRSINPNYLWKFRPYYEANDGTRYYGEWKGMDPSDYSYFEPTVHTYASVTVNENTAMVKGYAQRGTDNVTSQGFLYWPNDGNYVKAEQPMRVTEVPDDAQKVTAKGTVMTAKLTGLSYNTTYSYVAFVETSEGETFYGEEMTFQTGDDLTGIEPIHNAPCITHNEEAIYDLQGRRQTKMQKGINIIRMSNGTTHKVLVK